MGQAGLKGLCSAWDWERRTLGSDVGIINQDTSGDDRIIMRASWCSRPGRQVWALPIPAIDSPGPSGRTSKPLPVFDTQTGRLGWKRSQAFATSSFRASSPLRVASMTPTRSTLVSSGRGTLAAAMTRTVPLRSP